MEQNFDFNKVFNKGISFMSKDTEENVRYKLVQSIEDRKKKSSNTIYPTNTNGKDNKEEIKESINKIMAEIEEFDKSREEKMEIKFTEFLLRVYIEKNLKAKY